MKKVYKILVNGQFYQYVKLSSISKYIKYICENFKDVSIEIAEISKNKYLSYYGE